MPDDLTPYVNDLIDAFNKVNNDEAQAVRDDIYTLLMNNEAYFRDTCGCQFDSDDDLECEINSIVKKVKNGQKIIYVKQPPVEFDNKLLSMVEKYISLGGRDDILSIDA